VSVSREERSNAIIATSFFFFLGRGEDFLGPPMAKPTPGVIAAPCVYTIFSGFETRFELGLRSRPLGERVIVQGAF